MLILFCKSEPNEDGGLRIQWRQLYYRHHLWLVPYVNSYQGGHDGVDVLRGGQHVPGDLVLDLVQLHYQFLLSWPCGVIALLKANPFG